VVGHVGVHAPHHAEPVGVTGHRRKQLADLQAALAVAGEGEGGGERGAGSPFGLEAAGDLPAGIGLEGRLAVEGVEVAGAAVGEDMDHRPGSRGEVRRTGGEGGRQVRRGRGLIGKQARRPEPAEAEAGAHQRPAAGENRLWMQRLVGHGVNWLLLGETNLAGVAPAISLDVRRGHPGLRSLEGNLASPSWLRSDAHHGLLHGGDGVL